MSDSVQAIYRTSDANVRASFGADQAQALEYYEPLFRFVADLAPAQTAAGPCKLLDVGCGNGWSTFGFATAGYDATGIDLNASAFEPPPHDLCRLVPGSATAIPFPADSFNAVTCYQCLEHVPDPALALSEMARVCRPGGVIAIIGPNLCSPILGIAYIVKPAFWKTLKFRRRPGMARHPYGNTVPELLATSVVRTVQLTGKLLRGKPQFIMREPDTVPPFHADNDACYLCNPTDLITYFKSQGYRIERRGKPGRLPLTYLLAGGTWVAARKPTC